MLPKPLSLGEQWSTTFQLLLNSGEMNLEKAGGGAGHQGPILISLQTLAWGMQAEQCNLGPGEACSVGPGGVGCAPPQLHPTPY